MNLIELSNLIHNKESSVLFLQQRGLLHRNRVCLNNHQMVLTLSDKEDRWRCNRIGCRTQIQLRSEN